MIRGKRSTSPAHGFRRFDTMRKLTPALVLIASSAMLAGCGSGGGLLNRDRPDEFAVQRQAPLVVPPDFNLVPPEIGRAHVRPPVTHAHLVCRPLLGKKQRQKYNDKN